MKVKVLALALLYVVGSFVCGCGTDKSTKEGRYKGREVCGLTVTGDKVEAKVGEEFFIRLGSNPSTGYRWRIVEPLPDMVQLQGHKYIPGTWPPKLGGGCIEEWRFKAVQAGKATVKLEYLRPWDESSIVERRTFTVLTK
jgi:predicted secreted protein